MAELLEFSLVAFGMTAIIVYGSIFESGRKWFYKHTKEPWNRFFLCPLCVGFWVGLVVGPGDLFSNRFFAGCAASGICYFLSGYYEAMFRKGCRGCKG